MTRRGCHLCEEAIGELRSHILDLGPEGAGIEVEEVDIEADDELHRRYLERIPVFLVGEETMSEFAFDRDAFQRALGARS